MNTSKTLICGKGILNKIHLVEKEDRIFGNINIRISANNIVSFKANEKKITRNGKINPSYKALRTMSKEYKDTTMVQNIEDADIITIQNNFEYPNANFYNMINYDMNKDKIYHNNFKKIKLATRKETKLKQRIIFKSYGVYVEKIEGKYIYTRLIDYKSLAQKQTFYNYNDVDIKEGEILDIIGTIFEGLIQGVPCCNYNIVKARKSFVITMEDVKNSIINYEKYIQDIRTQESPF